MGWKENEGGARGVVMGVQWEGEGVVGIKGVMECSGNGGVMGYNGVE